MRRKPSEQVHGGVQAYPAKVGTQLGWTVTCCSHHTVRHSFSDKINNSIAVKAAQALE
jgi:hypothetical protein